jgi:hypothetical protein
MSTNFTLSPCQNYKNVMDELTGEQLASMFSSLQKLDLRANQLSDGAVSKFAQAFRYEYIRESLRGSNSFIK